MCLPGTGKVREERKKKVHFYTAIFYYKNSKWKILIWTKKLHNLTDANIKSVTQKHSYTMKANSKGKFMLPSKGSRQIFLPGLCQKYQ